MKRSFCALFFFIFVVAWSQDKADTSKTKLKAYATVSLNSNGIASIPAFSLGAPAIIASVSLAKNTGTNARTTLGVSKSAYRAITVSPKNKA